MEQNYVTYHCHSSLSLLDSCSDYHDYIEKAVELKQKAIAFTEHGNIFRWVAKKMACDKAGIKYIHGVEIYLTLNLNESFKVRDNYHTVLLAKNYEGVKEINTLVSNSYDDKHFYYKPRITFEEFANISDNVIKISACLGSPLYAIDKVVNNLQESKSVQKDDAKLIDIDNYINEVLPWKDKLLKLYDFLEIQYHNDAEQIKYNKYLWQKSNELNIPLIAGTDTHNLNYYKAECRSVLMEAKGIKFSDDGEGITYDLNYKSYDELVEMFERQEALPKQKYLEAIDNTNLLYDMVEDFELDMSFKYPVVSNDDKAELRQRLNKAFNKLKKDGIITDENREQYISQVKEEIRVFEKIEMCGFILSMDDLIGWCRDNNIPVGTGRGSVAGSTIAYMLGITDVNPQVWGTVFSRFANEDRKEIGDIDVDFAPNDREKVYNHIIEQFGQGFTSYILAITTVKEKGCIDEIGRCLHNREKEDLKNGIISESQMIYTLDYLKKVKAEYEVEKSNQEDNGFEKYELIVQTVEVMKTKYPEIFKYFLGILDTPIAQSIHPAGMVISPLSLVDNYGVLYKNNMQILQLDMEDVHETGLVKYDILGLKNIQIIKDTCELIGVDYPRADSINWEDVDVWKDMVKTGVGLFQFESPFAFQSLQKFKPGSIADMSLVTAAIRPSGTSYRDKLFKKEFNKNPSDIIDEMLKDNYGFLIYQEDTIQFLQQICGLTGSEADNIRRAIGRKQADRLAAAMPRILDGYCKMSKQPIEIAEEEAKAFLQVIEDSASYQFGKNHSVAYCMIGYLCAYYRYHYTPQFIVAFLNNAANEDDIRHGFELARIYGYNIEPPRFRYAKSNYSYIEGQTIYKGLSSVKWLNDAATEYLYTLRDMEFSCFTELLITIKKDVNSQVDSRKMEILIKLNFFEEFGGNKKLMTIYQMFNSLYGSKQFNRSRELPISEDWLLSYATRVTDKTIFMEGGSKVIVDLIERPKKFGKGEKSQWEAINTKQVIYYNVECTDTTEPVEPRIVSLLKDYEQELPNEFYSIKEQMKYDEEFYGYVNMKYDVHANYCLVQSVDVTYSPKIDLYSLGKGTTSTFKVPKWLFKDKPLKTGQSIIAIDFEEKPRWQMLDNGKFAHRTDGSTEMWLMDYEYLSDEEWCKATGDKFGAINTEYDYDKILIYDLETGGFSGTTDDVLEVGYILCDKVDNKLVEIERNQFLVKTSKMIMNSHIHNITNNMCNEGISQNECIEHMSKYFSDPTILVCGYNIIKFDNKFFSNYAERITGKPYKMVNDMLDLQPIIKDRLNVQKGFKLENAVQFYQLSGREQAHRAMSDVVDTLNVANAYLAEGKDLDKWIKRGEEI